jgi:hypothetical protein
LRIDQAMLKASELLSTSEFLRIEVWKEARVVGALSVAKPDKDDFHSSEDDMSNVIEFRNR